MLSALLLSGCLPSAPEQQEVWAGRLYFDGGGSTFVAFPHDWSYCDAQVPTWDGQQWVLATRRFPARGSLPDSVRVDFSPLYQGEVFMQGDPGKGWWRDAHGSGGRFALMRVEVIP